MMATTHLKCPQVVLCPHTLMESILVRRTTALQLTPRAPAWPHQQWRVLQPSSGNTSWRASTPQASVVGSCACERPSCRKPSMGCCCSGAVHMLSHLHTPLHCEASCLALGQPMPIPSMPSGVVCMGGCSMRPGQKGRSARGALCPCTSS